MSVLECRDLDTAEEALAEAEALEKPVENITLAVPSHAAYGAEGEEESPDAAPIKLPIVQSGPIMDADVQSDQQQLEIGCSPLLLATEQGHR